MRCKLMLNYFIFPNFRWIPVRNSEDRFKLMVRSKLIKSNVRAQKAHPLI